MSDNQMSQLVNGIAVIIDDEIGKENKNINDLISQIKGIGMPCAEHTELPVPDKFIAHIHGVSFILLDWNLWSSAMSDENGIPLTDVSIVSFEDANIKFLKEIHKTHFVPVFIFTNEDVGSITTKLTEKGLYYEDGRPNFVFVKSKDDLTKDGSLFKEISDWICANPPVYVLKTWEHEYRTAKNGLFAEFYKFNPSWVTVLKEGFEKDKLPMPAVSVEIMTLITNNISARMRMAGLSTGLEDSISKSLASNHGSRKLL
jgi:hypothetical protein